MTFLSLLISGGFNRYKYIIEAILAAMLIGFVSYEVHTFIAYEQKIGYDKRVAEDNAQKILDDAVAKELAELRKEHLQKANDDAQIRNDQIRSLANSNAALTGSVHDISTALVRASAGQNADALRKSVETFGLVFDDCQRRYSGMAEEAARLSSDKQKLMEAWPR